MGVLFLKNRIGHQNLQIVTNNIRHQYKRHCRGHGRVCQIQKLESILYNNLCTPFKHDIRCASLCGVEFVITKERRKKRAQRESCLKGVRSLQEYVLTHLVV